jgi:hypothetical protein
VYLVDREGPTKLAGKLAGPSDLDALPAETREALETVQEYHAKPPRNEPGDGPPRLSPAI